MRPSKVLATILVTASITAVGTPSIAQPPTHTQVWSARAATHVFPDSPPSG